ncbi:protein of unknown function DUF574 [Parafrankia sp. EAN1pec]|nr:protein of unknown function DUF574 [Frankia sp. EAN1pec]
MCNPGVVPIVLAHARALLTSTPEGRTSYLHSDVRDIDHILGAQELKDTLDLTRPVALSLIAVFHFIPDSDDPYGIIRRLVDALPSGSYVALTHLTADFDPAMLAVQETYLSRGVPMHLRDRAQVERFFDGLELLEPGLQVVHRWRPDGAVPADLTDAAVSIYGGLAYKA